MIDSFLLFTPILLLAIVALLGFVGCNWVFGIHETVLSVPPEIGSIQPAFGSPAGGTAVTITGAKFVATPTVAFGGTAGTVQSATDSEIDVTTPAHTPGLVDVVVTNPDGESDTLSSGFNFTQVALAQPVQTKQLPGAPPISVILPNTQTGSLIVVTVSWGLAGILSISDSAGNGYQSAGNGNWSGQQAQMFVAINQSAGNLTVTASGPGTTGPCSICVAEYLNEDSASPLYGFTHKASPSTGGALNVVVTAMNAGDLIYAVAFAQSGNLAASGGFTAAGSSTLGTISLLAADQVAVTPEATTIGIMNSVSTSAWVILATAIRLG